MSSTFANISVSDTATITTADIINLNADNINTNSINTDSLTLDELSPTASTLTLNGSIINIGNTSSIVNIVGTTNYIQSNQLQIKDNLITVNKGGTNATAIGAGIEIEGSGIIKASMKLDNNMDFTVSSPNNKLTVANLNTTNITGVSSVAATSANITTLTISGTSNLNGDVNLGDSALDSIGINGTTNFNNGITVNSGSTVTKGISNTGAISTTTLSASGGITGTISTPAQPTITSLGTLSSLTVSGTTSLGNLTGLQNTTGTAQFGSLGTNLYINNTANKIGFGTGSTLTATEKVEIIGGLKLDSLNLASFTPSTLTTTTLNVSGASTQQAINCASITSSGNAIINGNTTLGDASTDLITMNGIPTINNGFKFASGQSVFKIGGGTVGSVTVSGTLGTWTINFSTDAGISFTTTPVLVCTAYKSAETSQMNVRITSISNISASGRTTDNSNSGINCTLHFMCMGI